MPLNFFISTLTRAQPKTSINEQRLDQGNCHKVSIMDMDSNKPYREENVLSWRGVPYAEPPLNSRRFMPPIPFKSSWSLTDATKLSAMCMQKPTEKDISNGMSEDVCT